jgi:hypothetical protein
VLYVRAERAQTISGGIAPRRGALFIGERETSVATIGARAARKEARFGAPDVFYVIYRRRGRCAIVARIGNHAASLHP